MLSGLMMLLNGGSPIPYFLVAYRNSLLSCSILTRFDGVRILPHRLWSDNYLKVCILGAIKMLRDEFEFRLLRYSYY